MTFLLKILRNLCKGDLSSFFLTQEKIVRQAVKLFIQHRSVQVLFILTIYLMVAPYLPGKVHQGFYTISVLIKDLLLWMLPLTVGFFIAHAISSFEKRAPLFVLALFLFEALSNSASVWYSYGCAHLASSHLPAIEARSIDDAFSPLWRFFWLKPSWWSADKGTFAGIIFGLLGSLNMPRLKTVISNGKGVAERILTRIFSRLIPLFILGFVARMVQTRVLNQMFAQYADLLLWLFVFLAIYLAFLFLLGSGLSLSRFLNHVKNIAPAGGVAFSSGCSLSTMPWTIEGASKNLKNPDLAKAVIPATTNIQQIGDCIANTFLCFLIYHQFYGAAPSLAVWISFSIVFVLARFATAAVLGGAIFVMLPIYESYLAFTPEMIAMILAFNVILDPVITCTNVVANGALCRVFERVWLGINPKKSLHSSFE
jgi:hypothetical protein